METEQAQVTSSKPEQAELTPSRVDTPTRFDPRSGYATPTRFDPPSGYTTPLRDDYEDPSPQRNFNPPPPPELKEEAAMADVIKGTGISKNWVFSVLLNLLKEVEKYSGDGADIEDSEVGLNISEDQQTQLGFLWDFSMNLDVAEFLMDPESKCNIVSILIPVIMRSRAPRINEMCIGILGNLCCVPEICETLSQNELFVKLICLLLSNVEFDAPTLREAMRAVTVCIKNPAVGGMWIQAVMDTPDVLLLIMFVLKSALDVALLKITGELLDTMMDKADQLCGVWASPELVENIVIAIKQIGERKKEEVKPFLHVFQLLSTSEPGVESLMVHSDSVMGVLMHWLREVCDEDLLIVDDHLNILNSVISVLNLLMSVNHIAHRLSTKPHVFKDMVKVLESLYIQHQQYDNPAALPTCIFSPRKSLSNTPACDVNKEPTDPFVSPKAEAMNTMSWESVSSEDGDMKGDGQDNSEQQTEKESWQGRCEERTELSQLTVGYRTLVEVLQVYFRKFFNFLKLPERSHRKSTDERKLHTPSKPEYYPVLKQLETCPRRHLSYLVSVLVYNVPPSDVIYPFDVVGDGTSPEGWMVVKHVQYLCHLLNLRKVRDQLEDVVSTVKLTAGLR